MKLEIKLLVLFSLISILPLSVYSIWNGIRAEEVSIQKIKSDLHQYAEVEEKNIQFSINSEFKLLDSIKSRTVMRQLVQQYYETKDPQINDKIDLILHDAISAIPDIKYLSIIGKNGTVIFSTEENFVGLHYENFKIFNEGKTRNYVSFDSYLKEIHGVNERLILHVVGPITRDGEFLGVMVVDTDAYTVLPKGDFSNLGTTAEYVLGKKLDNGDVLIVNQLNRDKDASMKTIIPKEADFPLVVAFENREDILDTVDYRGVPVLAATRYIDGMDLSLVIKVDKSEIYESIILQRNAVITVLVVIGAGIFVTSLLVSRQIQHKMRYLEVYLTKIGEHDFNYVPQIRGKDEFAQITTKIQLMVSKLKDYSVLQEAEKMKDEFSAMITHELKTPLVPIVGYCKMLKNRMIGELNQEQQEAIVVIDRNVKQIERLIGDIMDARKLDLGKMKFNIEAISVDDFFDNLNLNYKQVLLEKGKEFITNLQTRGLIIKIDKNRMQQVFDNLISNAVKFTPDKFGKIEVGCKNENSKIVFYVKDDGEGISIESQQNLFKKFYQIDTSERRKLGGAGLGLAICKGIVENLNGKIWVESDGLTGTTFYIEFPIY